MRKVKNKPHRSIIVRLLVIGVSVYMVLSLSNLYSLLHKDRVKLQNLEKQYADMKVQIDDLKLKIAEGSETELIIDAARNRLGYVFPDEEVYTDTSGN